MRWKLFAILILYTQLQIIVDVYATGFVKYNALTWVMSFPVCVATLGYAFKFPLGKPMYWRWFAWIYAAYLVVIIALMGHRLHEWRAHFPNLAWFSFGLTAGGLVILFSWLAVWEYSRDPTIWNVWRASAAPSKSSSLPTGNMMAILRSVFPLPVYVIVFLMVSPLLITGSIVERMTLSTILIILALMIRQEFKILRRTLRAKAAPDAIAAVTPSP